MPKLCIVETPLTGGIFTAAISTHLPSVFDGCGYVAKSPVEGVSGQHIPLGTPCEGYTHFLLIGEPAFLHGAVAGAGSAVCGIYALPLTQFVGIEHVGWAAKHKVCTPSVMSSAAIQLAADTPSSPGVVAPWGVPPPPAIPLNKTEMLQLICPTWDSSLPTMLAHSRSAPLVLAAMSKDDKFRTLFIGEVEPAQKEHLLGLYSVKPERVHFTDSDHVWRAADLYLGLEHECYWPWDVMQAVAHKLPVACIQTHVYESLIAEGNCAYGIPAHDVVTVPHTAYRTNSTDIAAIIRQFYSEPIAAQVKAEAAFLSFAGRTQAAFTKDLIRALFAEESASANTASTRPTK